MPKVVSFYANQRHKEMYTNNKNLTQNNIRLAEVCKVLIVDYEKESDALNLIKKIRSGFNSTKLLILLIDETNKNELPSLIHEGIDDFIIKPINQDELKFRINLANIRSQRNTSINPLSKLPGNEFINKIIANRLNQPLSILYIDLDNFKAYNDHYGYFKGDAVLKHTADLLTSIVSLIGKSTDVVGNIGGDDFVIITSPEEDEILAKKICFEFDKNIKQFYTKTDQVSEKITTFDRQNILKTYPIMTVSIAIVHNELKQLVSIAHISELAAELKRYAKSKPNNAKGSNFVKDRRR